MKKTPSIMESNQSYSAIVEELVFKDGDGGISRWIPEEAATDYVTYEDKVIRGDGVYMPEDADFFREVKVENIISGLGYSVTITENGSFYIPDILPGTDAVKKVTVKVDNTILKSEKKKVYRNGTYISRQPGGFSEVEVAVYERPSGSPDQEDLVSEEDFYINGFYLIEETHPGKLGWASARAKIYDGSNMQQTISTMEEGFGNYCAACMAENGLNIFSENKWFDRDGVHELPFSAKGLSAFYLPTGNSRGIHLVGQAPGESALHYRYYDGAWNRVNVQAPGHWISPNIVNCNGRIFSVGSGYIDQGYGGASTTIYEFDADNSVWVNRADMGDFIMLFNSDPVVWWNGKIHVWKGNHMSFNIDTYEWSEEEESYSDLFTNDLSVLGDPGYMRVVAVTPSLAVMVNAKHSTLVEQGHGMTTMAMCQRTANGYIYRPLGFLPYVWMIDALQTGLGQGVVADGSGFHVIGTPGDASDKITYVNLGL